ncbi:MAG: imidazole glycerol-phosphate synthase subunit HisH [Actinomycetota bacterium]|jgi:glutamine amidotransferase|nr:imidazole glycerol-phosphate synthase subunit HisH [Actinomycetota bacterium]
MGNLRSVAKALEAVGATVEITAEPDAIGRADKLCVPGQGIFGKCAANLRAGHLDIVISDWIAGGRPYLGICLGMQVLFDTSEEHGPVSGIGLLSGHVERLSSAVRVPHMGWNEVDDEHYYFDHSYVVRPVDPTIVSGWCEYGGRFAARIETGPILGVQFHPEKSAAAGLALLEGWVTSSS